MVEMRREERNVNKIRILFRKENIINFSQKNDVVFLKNNIHFEKSSKKTNADPVSVLSPIQKIKTNDNNISRFYLEIRPCRADEREEIKRNNKKLGLEAD